MVAAMQPNFKSGGTGTSGAPIVIYVNATSVRRVVDMFRVATLPYSLFDFLKTSASDFFRDDIESRFEEEGDPKSGFWKPLKDATIDIRRADGFGDGPINERTGELRDFMTGDYDVMTTGSGAVMQVPGNPGGSELASKLATAQRGSINNPLGYGPTPPRPVLAISEMDVFTLTRLLQVHIVRVVTGVSFL